jgi:hypothetical protein
LITASFLWRNSQKVLGLILLESCVLLIGHLKVLLSVQRDADGKVITHLNGVNTLGGDFPIYGDLFHSSTPDVISESQVNLRKRTRPLITAMTWKHCVDRSDIELTAVGDVAP